MSLLSTPAMAQRGNPAVAFDGQSVDQMIAEFMREHDIPGMTLAIVQAPYITRVVGYGVADVEKGLLASPKALWNVGQMTQAFTAVAIMQLVEAGKLGLDDPVGKHVPDLPAAWQPITIRQLMGHASGLADYTRQASFDPVRDYTPAEVLALVTAQPLAFEPGTQVAASGTNFFLLGLVVEKASGMSYEAYVTANQIQRLGLRNTIFSSGRGAVRQEDVTQAGLKHRQFLAERVYIDPTEVATGYATVDGRRVPVAPNSQGAWSANGAVWASAEDISLWDIGLAGNLLIKDKANRDFLYHGTKLKDGRTVPAHAGWVFPGHKGLMAIHGDVPGFSVYLSRFTDPAELLCVTLCANKSGVDLSELARRIAGAFDRRLGPPVGPSALTCVESCYPVAETLDRLEAFLRARGVTVAARVDHAAAAKDKGLELRPTAVLIFGNPAVGTALMQSRQAIAADLPLRVAVWQEADSSVWLGYPDVAALAERYEIADRAAVVGAMRAALSAAVRHAARPY